MVEEGLQQQQGSQHPLEVHGEAVVGSYAALEREALARADQWMIHGNGRKGRARRETPGVFRR